MKKIIGRVLIVIPALAIQVLWYWVLLMLLNKLFFGYLAEVVSTVFSILAVIFVTNLIA